CQMTGCSKAEIQTCSNRLRNLRRERRNDFIGLNRLPQRQRIVCDAPGLLKIDARILWIFSAPLRLIGFEMISVVEPQPAGADLVAQVEEIFSPKGILSRAKNFEYRPQQQQMAMAVARALQSREHLAVEAGTGVGKSLAYLVPAILFAVADKKKAVISTHTINLQEQLTQKDLPMLAGVLGALTP